MTTRLWGEALRRFGRNGSVVLCYHGVAAPAADVDPGSLRVSPDSFRAQVELLLEAGFEFLTVAEFVRRARGGTPPPGLAALSFDDGMDDNHSVVLPILRDYGIPATVYVVTGLIGMPNPWLSPGAHSRMMTVEELRELADAGVELGAHSVTHPDFSQLDRETSLREMVESRDTLERLTGAAVTTFAYPFCKYNAASAAAAREAGFDAAVTCWERGSWDPYELKRPLITGRDGIPSFVLKIVGVYLPLFDNRGARIARAATHGLRRKLRRGSE